MSCGLGTLFDGAPMYASVSIFAEIWEQVKRKVGLPLMQLTSLSPRHGPSSRMELNFHWEFVHAHVSAPQRRSPFLIVVRRPIVFTCPTSSGQCLLWRPIGTVVRFLHLADLGSLCLPRERTFAHYCPSVSITVVSASLRFPFAFSEDFE